MNAREILTRAVLTVGALATTMTACRPVDANPVVEPAKLVVRGVGGYVPFGGRIYLADNIEVSFNTGENCAKLILDSRNGPDREIPVKPNDAASIVDAMPALVEKRDGNEIPFRVGIHKNPGEECADVLDIDKYGIKVVGQ